MVKYMFKKVLLFVLSVFLINSAKADSIAVVNVQEVLDNSLIIIDATKSLNKEKDDYQKKFSDKELALTKERDSISTRSSILSQADMQKEVEIFQKKVVDFQNEVKETEAKLQQKMADILTKVSTELKTIISDMLKEKEFSKYSKVINSEALLHYDAQDDITKDVLLRLNKKFKNLKSLGK